MAVNQDGTLDDDKILRLHNEALSFKESELYAHLLSESLIDATHASNELLNINPTESEAIRDLQNRAFLSYNLLVRIDEVITLANNLIDLKESES